MSLVFALAALLAGACPAVAQVTGSASVLVNVFPDLDHQPGAQSAGEVRVRLVGERRDDVGEHLRLVMSGAVDGVVRRVELGGTGPRSTAGALAQPLDLHAEGRWSRADLRVGVSRIAWGRLDEFQPTDVVNPIDVARFILEGRSEARLPVALVRARLFLPKSTTLEMVLVPVFRAGRFDQLDEESSPFDLRARGGDRRRRAPAFGSGSIQGGARVTATTGRVDWGTSVYRGVRSFPTATVVGSTSQPVTTSLSLLETFPRFTMVGADFETVRGEWGIRGELAAFIDDELQSTRYGVGVAGHSMTGGVGVDRRAGEYRVAANVLWSRTAVDQAHPAAQLVRDDPDIERTDVSLVAAVDRSFARQTRTVRVFSVYDPADATMFGRVIGGLNLRDNVWLELSGGLFLGSAPDFLGRLTKRDFAYTRLKVSF